MLATDGYGRLGGIAQFNRDLLDALNATPRVERVTVWPRHAPALVTEPIPEAVVYDRRFATGKGAFLLRAVAASLAPPAVDLVICAHLHLLPLAWLAARRTGARLALMLFGIECWRPTRSPLANFLANAADDVFAISRFTAQKFCKWSGVAPERCLILPCCVDLDALSPGERPACLEKRYGVEGRKTLMTIGRLAPEERYKGVDEVLDLMPRLVARFPDLAYLVVGEGEDSERLRAKAKRLALCDNVIFTGRIDEAEKSDHYRLADVFAMPSVGEGFGIVLIEAAACGARIIGSRVDGSREALLDGALGALVDPRDPDELYEALVTAIAAPRQGARNAAVEAFARPAFRIRVADWIERVAARVPQNTAAV